MHVHQHSVRMLSCQQRYMPVTVVAVAVTRLRSAGQLPTAIQRQHFLPDSSCQWCRTIFRNLKSWSAAAVLQLLFWSSPTADRQHVATYAVIYGRRLVGLVYDFAFKTQRVLYPAFTRIALSPRHKPAAVGWRLCHTHFIAKVVKGRPVDPSIPQAAD
jgi:hypothetical protein